MSTTAIQMDAMIKPKVAPAKGNDEKFNPMDELNQLREENARLKALLTSHGIAWQETTDTEPKHSFTNPATASVQYSIAEKIRLFRRLFRGRTDVYPLRWESAKGGSGYSPACSNEWKPGVCLKPKAKCGDCLQRELLPVNDQVIYDHLAGKHTIGVYPLLEDDLCHFLAADFDEVGWREDARAFMDSCRELNAAYSADDAHLIRAKTPSGSRARRPLHRSEATLVF